MTTAGRGQVWTGEQLSARLAALGGAAPEVTQHVVYWAVSGLRAAGRPMDGYWVPEAADCLVPASFDVWLAQRGLAGAARLAVAVLVIRAALTPNGEIDSCALEYRRGAADGPYHGSPARIVFSGPAQDVRFHQALPDGQLAEIAPTPCVKARLDAAGEDFDTGDRVVAAALAAWFDASVRVVGARAPTVVEAMVGMAHVLFLRQPGVDEAACGILWHGPIAVALPAMFPRFDVAPLLTPAQQAALTAVLAAERLIRCQTRRDDQGLAVLARHRATHEPVLIRFDGDLPRIVPYVPGLPPGITEAQTQWVHYIETYEHLRVRDAYRGADSLDLVVITQAADGKAWRHGVDDDGVETWRTAEAAEASPADRLLETAEPADAPVATLAPSLPVAVPFGDLVDRRFPAAAYDIDEATHCLAQGRSTAAVFHALRVLTHGLDAYAAWRGEPNPPIERGEQRWRVLLRWVRDDRGSRDLHAALEGVRTAWRGATLRVAPKYTEAEAQQIIHQVERFMRGLAGLCDEDGVPASELDDEV